MSSFISTSSFIATALEALGKATLSPSEARAIKALVDDRTSYRADQSPALTSNSWHCPREGCTYAVYGELLTYIESFHYGQRLPDAAHQRMHAEQDAAAAKAEAEHDLIVRATAQRMMATAVRKRGRPLSPGARAILYAIAEELVGST